MNDQKIPIMEARWIRSGKATSYIALIWSEDILSVSEAQLGDILAEATKEKAGWRLPTTHEILFAIKNNMGGLTADRYWATSGFQPTVHLTSELRTVVRSEELTMFSTLGPACLKLVRLGMIGGHL